MPKENKTVHKKTESKKKKVNRIDTSKVIEKKDDAKIINTNNLINEQHTTFNLLEVIIIMIITAIFGIFVGSFVTFLKNDVIDKEDTNEFISVYNDLLNNYYGDIDKDELMDAAISGMMSYLGDNYSEYLNEESTVELEESLEGEYVGLGAYIGLNESNQLYFASIIEGSPAEKQGIKYGDILLKVDGKSVDGYLPSEVSTIVKGKENTKCNLTLLRDGKTLDIEFTRSKIEIKSVSYSEINSNTGYISISIFAKNTYKQFTEAMKVLKKDGITNVIIDLRDNNGGYLSVAKNIAQDFVNKGETIYQLKDNSNGVTKVVSDNDKVYDVKLAVLINGESASASEVLASCLNENAGAILVGQKSYGKGSVQTTKTLSSGAMIKYTINEWLTSKGNKVNGVGIIPTKVVEEVDGKDAQLEAAIEELK